MKLTAIFICAYVLPVTAIAQYNFQPGMVKKSSGGEVRGWIDYRQWNKNPRKVEFKESPDGTVTKFSTTDISMFEVTGKDVYITAIVIKDMRPVKHDELTANTTDSVSTDTVFLRELVRGDKISLYVLNDKKEHFYIKEPNGNYEELTYKVYLLDNANGYYLDEQSIYRTQLKKIFLDNADFYKLEMILDKTPYSEKGLTHFVRRLNSLPNTVRATGKKTAFFVSAGAQFSSLKVSGKDNLEAMQFSGSITPAFGAGLDIFSLRGLNDLTIRIEALYSSSHFKGNGSTTDFTGTETASSYNLKVTSVTPGISLNWAFIRNSTSRIYAGAGVAYNFSSYPQNQYIEINKRTNITTKTDNYLKFEKSWTSAYVQAGAILKNRFEVIASVKAMGSFSNYTILKLGTGIYSLRGAYRF